MVSKKPYLVKFGTKGDNDSGYHSYAEYATTLPFEPNRVFWVYNTPEDTARGNTANIETKIVFVSLVGEVKIHLQDLAGKSYDFILENPQEGLYVPEKTWRRISMSQGSVLLCISSHKFDEKDHVRDFREFKKMGRRR